MSMQLEHKSLASFFRDFCLCFHSNSMVEHSTSRSFGPKIPIKLYFLCRMRINNRWCGDTCEKEIPSTASVSLISFRSHQRGKTAVSVLPFRLLK